MKNRPTANATAITIVTTQVAPETCSPSPSGSCALAEMPSARSPRASDSASATTPRTIGRRQTRCRRTHGSSGNRCSSIRPSPCSAGLRTATAQVRNPRIITPSRTAWPPRGASHEAVRGSRPPATPGAYLGSAAGARSAPSPGRPALEALHASARVDELLAAGVEGVAGRADLDVDLGLGRAGRELIAARAAHVCFDVFGMDVSFHVYL